MYLQPSCASPRWTWCLDTRPGPLPRPGAAAELRLCGMLGVVGSSLTLTLTLQRQLCTISWRSPSLAVLPGELPHTLLGRIHCAGAQGDTPPQPALPALRLSCKHSSGWGPGASPQGCRILPAIRPAAWGGETRGRFVNIESGSRSEYRTGKKHFSIKGKITQIKKKKKKNPKTREKLMELTHLKKYLHLIVNQSKALRNQDSSRPGVHSVTPMVATGDNCAS